MVVLKAKELAGKGAKTQVFSLRDVAREAEGIIAAARREYDRIIEQGKKQAELAKKQAHKEGYEDGYKVGSEVGRKEGYEKALSETREQFGKDSEQVLKSLRLLLSEFDQSRYELLWRAEQGALVLAIEIAEKVIKREVETNGREIALSNVKESLGVVSRASDVVIKVNPEDREYLEKAAGKNEVVFGKYKSICFEDDETVGRGGCRICTEFGRVDGDIEVQIRRIKDELIM